MTITVYSKPACSQCRMTTRWLDQRGIAYTTVDITRDAATYEAIRELEFSAAPVVAVRAPGYESDVLWSGFQPDLLAEHCLPAAA